MRKQKLIEDQLRVIEEALEIANLEITAMAWNTLEKKEEISKWEKKWKEALTDIKFLVKVDK